MFESRISAERVEKLQFPQNLRISSCSYDMAGDAKKCVERYCELAKKTTQQLYKVSTPCIDDHHFKEEEWKSVEEFSKVSSQIVVPIIWMSKKQTSVSHSSTESAIISLDARLRLDGIPALYLWVLIVLVLGNTTQNHNRTVKPVVCRDKNHVRHQSRRVLTTIRLRVRHSALVGVHFYRHDLTQTHGHPLSRSWLVQVYRGTQEERTDAVVCRLKLDCGWVC